MRARTPKPLSLDFHAPPRAAAPVIRWIVLALGTLIVAGALTLQQQADADLTPLRARNARLQKLAASGASARAAAQPDAAMQRQLLRANAIIDQMALPWGDLFGAIEGAGARGLAVLALTPDPKDNSFVLAGEAASLDEALAYVGRLAAQPDLARVHLISWETAQRDGVAVVQFSLGAQWRPS